jgi:hypothetical protein
VLSKILKAMTDLENKINDHYMKIYSSSMGLSVYVVQRKTGKVFLRTFSEQEISDTIDEGILIEEFVEDAVDFINKAE